MGTGTGRSRWGREGNENEKKEKNNKETVLRTVKEYGYFRSSTKHILLLIWPQVNQDHRVDYGCLKENELDWLMYLYA